MVPLGPFHRIYHRALSGRPPITEVSLGNKFPKDRHIFLYTALNVLLSKLFFSRKRVFSLARDVRFLLDA